MRQLTDKVISGRKPDRGIYDLDSYLPEKGEAMQRWEDHPEELPGASSGCGPAVDRRRVSPAV